MSEDAALARPSGLWFERNTAAVAVMVGLIMSLLTYTATVTLAYASVVKDVAVIRATIDERTKANQEEIVRLREELSRNREEIARLRTTVEQLRSDLLTERTRARQP